MILPFKNFGNSVSNTWCVSLTRIQLSFLGPGGCKIRNSHILGRTDSPPFPTSAVVSRRPQSSYQPELAPSALPALLEVARLPAGLLESAHGWQPLRQSQGLPLDSAQPVPGLKRPKRQTKIRITSSDAFNPFFWFSRPLEAIARHGNPHSSLPNFNFCCFFSQTEMLSFQEQFHSSSKR